jgi:hypothetical protein
MTSRSENARKRKQTTTIPEVLVSSDDDQNKSKARRVSTNALVPTAASLQVDTPAMTEEVTAANAASIMHVKQFQSIGKMIQDLADSDNAKSTLPSMPCF